MLHNAFISYSHKQDMDLAPSLERGLEKFAKSAFKRRALKIFRDANDLSASPDLWGKIVDGLNSSDYFILLASPGSAQSHWCGKEIDHWKEHKPMDHFLIAVTDGEILWDQGKNDFDWDVTTCIPKNLSNTFKSEPLFVDFRSHKDDDDLNLKNPEFKTKVVLLSATIHGKSVGDMAGEGIRQHKKTLRIRNGAIAVLSVLFLSAIGLSIYANMQKNVAEEKTELAITEGNTAKLKTYINTAKTELTENPTKALRLAEHAYLFAKAKGMDTKEAAKLLADVFHSDNIFYQDRSVRLPKELTNALKAKHNGISLAYSWKTDEDIFMADPKDTISSMDYDIALTLYEIDGSGQEVGKLSLEIDGAGTYVLGYTQDGQYIYVSYTDPTNYRNVDIYLYKRGTYEVFTRAKGQGVKPPIVFARNSVIISSDQYEGVNFQFPKYWGSDKQGISTGDILGTNDYISTVALSNNGEYSSLVSSNGRAIVLNNDMYRQRGIPQKYHYWKRYLQSSDHYINDLRFSENGTSVVTSNGENIKEWRLDNYPYIELQKESDHLFTDAVHLLEIHKDETYQPVAPATLKDKNGRVLIEFPRAADIRDELSGKASSFEFDIPTLIEGNNPDIYHTYSEDGKYYKITLGDYLVRIYPIDPDAILERVNNQNMMGNIAQLSVDDKKEYLINDDDLTGLSKMAITENAQPYKNDTPVKETESGPTEKKTVEVPKVEMVTIGTAMVNNLRVRTASNLNSETVTLLPIETQFVVMKEGRSSHKTTVTLDGKDISDHWYRIQLTDNRIGWVHGCCIKTEVVTKK